MGYDDPMALAKTAASEAELLLALVSTIQPLHTAGELEIGKQLSLRCPCGKMILPHILIQANIQDRQRGMLKARIERHLREDHGVSRYNIGQVLKDSFATSRVARR